MLDDIAQCGTSDRLCNSDVGFFLLFAAALGSWSLISVCFLLAFFVVQYQTPRQGKRVSLLFANFNSWS
jgi:hypothetical protein